AVSHRIDYAGAAVLTAAATCVLLACTWGGTTYPWDAPQVLGTAVAGVVLLAVFLRIERRVEEPVLPLGLFRMRIFAVSTVGGLVVGAVLFAVSIYVPVYSQAVQQVSATSSGVILIPFSLAWVASATITGQMISRTGRYRPFPIAGGAMVLVGLILLALLDAGSSPAWVGTILAVAGFGMGMTFQPYVIATQNAVDPANLGIATATIQFFRSMGGSLAVAALGTLLANRLAAGLEERLGPDASRVDTNRLLEGSGTVPADLAAGTHAALADALHAVFVAAVPLGVLAIVMALMLDEIPLRTRRTPEDAPEDEREPQPA
ncbi:MAG: hypothetical protein QOC64_191, partial [Solirubrobacteraceae bacterium]|nr:hypothetical protein [Solirubrobacteraceae bacterium]